MSDYKSIELTETIAAPKTQIFAAFTNSIALESWFTDVAEVDFTEKGRLYCWWNVGYYASGLFTRIVENDQIAFTWSGPDEPHGTLVEISFVDKDDLPKAFAPEVDMTYFQATEVKILHSGIGAGSEWVERVVAYNKGWEIGLANLKSVMETGIDKRVFDRPFLGIMPGDLIDDEIAQEQGLPTPFGITLTGTIEGYGAESAGLKKDDIIISLNKHDLKNYQDISDAIRNCKSGENVEVVYFRGMEKKVGKMTLSRRRFPEAPESAADWAESINKITSKVAENREALFVGISEKDATARPDPEAWSAKETLAHLLYTERWLHLMISCAVDGQRTPGFTNQLDLIAATARVYSLEDLLFELKKSEMVTVSTIKALPADFVADKRKFIGLVNGLEWYTQHSQDHFDQMEAALNSLKQN